MSVRRASVPWRLVVVAVTAIAVFVIDDRVTGSSSLPLDARAFEIAKDARAQWLDVTARVVTTLGVIAIVGPGVLMGAAVMIKHHDRAGAGAIVVGAALDGSARGSSNRWSTAPGRRTRSSTLPARATRRVTLPIPSAGSPSQSHSRS